MAGGRVFAGTLRVNSSRQNRSNSWRQKQTRVWDTIFAFPPMVQLNPPYRGRSGSPWAASYCSIVTTSRWR
jgi:hypothetical protein